MRKNYINNHNDDGQQEEKSDRYLLTYSDLITLLLGLFIILYASSQVDEAKYKEMSSAFTEMFGSTAKSDSLEMVRLGKKLNPIAILPEAQKVRSLNEIEQKAGVALDEYVRENKINIQRNGNNLVITLPELMLFASAKADIQQESGKLLDSLASVLSKADMMISIDGHTDASPIKSFRYESNWHLSTARALSVGYALLQRGVPEQNLIIRGFASQRPVADNQSDEGKSKNRRVEITLSQITSDAPTADGYEKK